jgi:hypothetical protein
MPNTGTAVCRDESGFRAPSSAYQAATAAIFPRTVGRPGCSERCRPKGLQKMSGSLWVVSGALFGKNSTSGVAC